MAAGPAARLPARRAGLAARLGTRVVLARDPAALAAGGAGLTLVACAATPVAAVEVAAALHAARLVAVWGGLQRRLFGWIMKKGI